jgi:hypothetical protein
MGNVELNLKYSITLILLMYLEPTISQQNGRTPLVGAVLTPPRLHKR